MARSADASTATAGRTRPTRSVVLAAVLALVVVALLWQEPARVSGAVPGGPAAAAVRSVEASLPDPVLADRRPQDPRRLRIPSLGVDAPVVPVRAVGRTLVPPEDPSRLGWWADGARPGSGRGSALVAGHTVHDGGGALEDLEQLRRGDRVTVRSGDTVVDYRVRTVRVLAKGVLARNAERLFAQDVPGRLVLITCERWDGEEYLSNVVVTAEEQGTNNLMRRG